LHISHQLLNKECVVAQLFRVLFALEAEALVGIVACVRILVGALPVRPALVAALPPPARLANAEVGRSTTRSVAKSVVAIQVAGWLVAQVTLPSDLADTGMGVVNAGPVFASRHLLADVAAVSRPSVVANALIGTDAVAVGAVGTAGYVAVGALPSLFAVALESVIAGAMVASRQWHADVAVGSFPPDFAGTEVWCPTFAVNASLAVIVADGLQTRVEGGLFVLDLRFLPSRLADDVALVVAHIPDGVLEVFGLAGVVVDVE
jgi:hypothetical protein